MEKPCAVFKLDLLSPATWPLDPVATIVRNNGVIVYPTDTIYGLGCAAYRAGAIEQVHRIKSRGEPKPMLVLIADPAAVDDLAAQPPESFFILAKRFWPGPLTMVLKAKKELPEILTAGTGAIGLRLPGLAFTRELIRRCETPLVSTSANPAGSETIFSMQKLIEIFSPHVAAILDAGDLDNGQESTVISLVDGRLSLLRAGRVSFAEIQATLS